MTIKAIETQYAGYRFRSRLEARWAVFFDAIGVKWQYEHEGYETSAGWYLPDFVIDQGYVSEVFDNDFDELYAEVKGGSITEADAMKCSALAQDRHAAVLMLGDIPDPRRYFDTSDALSFTAWWWEGGTYRIELHLHDKDDDYDFRPEGKGLNGVGSGDLDCVRAGFLNPPRIVRRGWSRNRGPQAGFTAARSARFEHGETPR